MTTMTTRIAIVGYGRLGRGVEHAVDQNPDMELVAIFTRRDPGSLEPVHGDVPVRNVADVDEFVGEIDVMVLCGGSRDDLPEQGPSFASKFNTVDSYDNHAEIPDYFRAMDDAARPNGRLALISTGWDPGLFSLNRLMAEAILPEGTTYSFWGRGVSQGHSAAVRRVEGVVDAVQYTIPSQDAISSARSGERSELTSADMHLRECYVVLADGADPDRVRAEIVDMPNYFAPYETIVHFVTADELARDHAGLPHGGTVIRTGVAAEGSTQTIEYRLELGSNPAFTSAVMVASARAVHRMSAQGQTGARTLFDVPPGLFSARTPEELRAGLL